MRITFFGCCLFLFVVPPSWAAAPALPYDNTPPQSVATLSLEWKDPQRQRVVPVKIYYPTATTHCPVIVFSHGLGGSREGYEYLGRYWASHGYVSAHLQHLGSDDSVWKNLGFLDRQGGMRKAANSENALARAKDVKFALDQITLLSQTAGVWQGKMDLNEIGLAGHSFGALTTMMGVGLKFSDQGSGLADPRIKAAIPMSTPLSQFAKGYEDITVPCLHMTGTEDNSPISETTAEQRRVPYDRMTSAPEYLIIFQGGDHMIFSGRSRLLAKPTDAVFQALIQQTTTAFWDTYLKKSDAAKNWLNQGGAEKALGKSATLEMKKVK